MESIKSTLTLIIFLFVTGIAFGQAKNKANTIVLVHGAWIDASAWYKVVPLLEAEGHEVIAVNLPGHGRDNTPYNKISLLSYVDVVKTAIGSKTNVTLVGHSLGGIIISQVAEEIPSQIKNLIYVAGFLPRNGESLHSLASQDKDSHVGKFWHQDDAANHSPVLIKKEGLKEVFAEDAPKADIDALIINNKADALPPLGTPVKLTDENFGKKSKIYIYTINDNAVTYTFQKQMTSATKVDKEYAIPTSHSPFLSKPKVLASILLEETQ